jgi:hypothetical protein
VDESRAEVIRSNHLLFAVRQAQALQAAATDALHMCLLTNFAKRSIRWWMLTTVAHECNTSFKVLPLTMHLTRALTAAIEWLGSTQQAGTAHGAKASDNDILRLNACR